MKTKRKFQEDYIPHDSSNLSEGWAAVAEYLDQAIVLAYDGCHKIYLAMDEDSAYWFRNEYRPNVEELTWRGERVVLAPQAELIVREWFDNSCSLKLVQAVWHNHEDPNSGYVSLISQFAEVKADD